MSSGARGRTNFWDKEYKSPSRTDSPALASSSDVPSTSYPVFAAEPSTFAFPNPSDTRPLFGVSSSAQAGPDREVAPYQTEATKITPSSADPTYPPTHEQPFFRNQENLESLSQLDPLHHLGLNQPSVEEPGSPQDNSLVLSSPRTAHNRTTVLSIQCGEATTTGLQVQGLLSINARVEALESRLQYLERGAQQGPGVEAQLQKSINAQSEVLHKLCSGIDRLATASNTAVANAAGAAVASASASAGSAAAAVCAAGAAAGAKEAAEASVDTRRRGVNCENSVARVLLESAAQSFSSGACTVLRAMAGAANEADLVVALLCHKVLLTDYKCKKGEDGQIQYMTLKSAKQGGLFLVAVEIAWLMCNKSIQMMPEALQFLLNPLLKPVRFCASNARWLGWLAFSYLSVRTVQQGCQHMAYLASLPSPPGTPRRAAVGAKGLHSPTPSELDVAVNNALAPVKCEHCGSTTCHGCCGGPSPFRVLQVPGWIMPPPPAKHRGMKRKIKQEEANPKVPVHVMPGAPGSNEATDDLPLPELEPDLDIKYAKAVRNMFRAAGSASVWVANNLHHVVNG